MLRCGLSEEVTVRFGPSASLVESCSIGQADVRFCDSSTGNGKGRRTAAIGSERPSGRPEGPRAMMGRRRSAPSPLRTMTPTDSQIKNAVGAARMRMLIVTLIGAAVAGCIPQSRRAQIDVGGGASVALIVSPMFGWHSDWHRKLSIKAPKGSLEIDLFEDTGWWRGSNLYRHESGLYVLHEGQAGCIIFSVSPPKVVNDPAISCDKSNQTVPGGTVKADTSSQGFPASRFYRDFQYIGQFVETPHGQKPISFIGADKQPEAEPSDIL